MRAPDLCRGAFCHSKTDYYPEQHAMAGHSKWANIQHRKGRQDEKRGKIWTRIVREITVAARTVRRAAGWWVGALGSAQ